MARYMRTDLGAGHSKLRPPAVVGGGITFAPIEGVLFSTSEPQWRLLRRRSKSRLRPPTVVGGAVVFVARPIARKLSPSSRLARTTHPQLHPPVVVDLRPQTRFLSINLAYSRRGLPRSKVLPPQVVAAAPKIVYPGISGHLAYSVRGKTRSVLAFPEVVAAGTVFRPIQGKLFPLTSALVPPIQAALRPPVVVTQIAVQLYYAAKPTLARIKPRRTESTLRPPAVVFTAVEIYGPLVRLAKISPSRTIRMLRPPIVVRLAVEVYGPAVEITYSTRRRGIAELRPPTVVRTVAFFGPAVNLAYSRRGVAGLRLRPPTVVAAIAVFYLNINLAPRNSVWRRNTQRAVQHKAFPPAVIDLRPQAQYLSINLAYGRRGVAKSRLEPPTVTTQVSVVVYYGPSVHLVKPSPRRSVRPTYVYPIVVGLAEAFGWIAINLVGIRPPAVYSQLRPPVVIAGEEREAGIIRGFLASTNRRYLRVRSNLEPPAVVFFAVEIHGPTVGLTYSRRGRSIYKLRPPRVIDLRPQTRFLSVNLTYSRRGRPTHFLRPAILAQAKQFESVTVKLTYSVRKRGRALLRQPVAVFPFFARPIDVTLARIHRPKLGAFLFSPVVIRARENVPTRISYVRIRPARTLASLGYPVAVRVPENIPTRVTLARIRPPQTVVAVRPPAVVVIPENRPARISLARITPASTVALLKPPTAITPAFVARAIQTYFAQIKPVPTIIVVQPPVVIQPFRPPAGDVCGFDIAGSFICSDESAPNAVSGTTAAGSIIAGSDQQEGNIAGGDQSGSTVSGSDQKLT